MARLLSPQRCCWLLLPVTLVSMAVWMLLTGPNKLTSHLRHQDTWWDYDDADLSSKGTCNCDAILRGEPEAVEQAKLLSFERLFRKRTRISDNHFFNVSQGCGTFMSSRKYLPFPLSREEAEFPIAFSLVVHHKLHNFERLLRSIYAPQNFYCVHVDTKAPASILAAVTSITSCFQNVFLCSRPVGVVYACWLRVQADINCMRDLYNISASWKYFVNLCGQDFPIKTNLEMVRSLKALKGRNSMESESMPSSKEGRWKKVHAVVNGQVQRTEEDKSPPPFDLPIKSGGGAYMVVTRGFVEHVLTDSRVLELLKWAEDTYSPGEFLWATIQRMPRVPGSQRPSAKYDTSDMQAITRLVKWQSHEGAEEAKEAVYPPCQGRHVRSVCVYGAGDLWWMLQQHHLFANKFDVDEDLVAVHCLEKHLQSKALTFTRP
ncbi:beta-1,3-galactosyl-O-glycosyl-glycoprotein beta-1,6-N-acetylglucosaminyltransferase-like [Osmerus mordax]|uniref:beta-1,3-galactosyl-O-glycosyl-glycoprotein beta-1,6-N-acetylglucosaminyltransferase-like n=1 Tax=Osmerus mordax TaxID=8014 RepID=UPI003510600E